LTGIAPWISVAPVGEQLLLIAVGAEPALGHVHDLRTGVGVLQLDHIDVLLTGANVVFGSNCKDYSITLSLCLE
jgi:hypothetical protein